VREQFSTTLLVISYLLNSQAHQAMLSKLSKNFYVQSLFTGLTLKKQLNHREDD